MPLKRTAEFKRDDFTYKSPDGDEYEITVVQTSDRKYVEIKREGDETQVQWDVEMLLDVADEIRRATQKRSTAAKTHALKKPHVIDQRQGNPEIEDQPISPAESIQASVKESMKQSTDDTSAVESFSGGFSSGGPIATEIEDRLSRPPQAAPDKAKVKTVNTGDLF